MAVRSLPQRKDFLHRPPPANDEITRLEKISEAVEKVDDPFDLASVIGEITEAPDVHGKIYDFGT